ncbi:MAG: hypothetical protein INF44_07735 [Thalassospira sp.]|nr:hypothetical protein [Thalassospira sp.]
MAAIAAVAAVAVDDGVIPNTARDYLKGIYHYCNWLEEALPRNNSSNENARVDDINSTKLLSRAKKL